MMFSYFNVDTVFIATGIKENISKFLYKSETSKGAVKVEGKEGWYCEKLSHYDRYCARNTKINTSLKLLCFSQFCQRYTPYKNKDKKPLPSPSKKADETDIEEGNFIKTDQLPQAEKSFCLPEFIEININDTIEYVKLRTPLVIRYHKYNKITNNHEFMISQMQLFLPHEKEHQLHPYDESKCKTLYSEVKAKIHAVKIQTLEHCIDLEEAQEKIALNNIGDELDPENEQLELDCEEEGITDYPFNLETELQPVNEKSKHDMFQKVKLVTNEQLRDMYLKCDSDQLLVIDIATTYANSLRKSVKGHCKPEKPPLIIVSGGAGTGKSHTINVIEQSVERILRTAGDELNCPYILKVAPTGVAAANISGSTLHSAFSFSFGSSYESLSDKQRDLKRNEFKNLKILIIDEISMINSDLLYKLHLRLGEIKLKPNELFGGVAVFLFGDIMQLRPVKSNYIFEKPKNSKFQFTYYNDPIWKKFQPIILKKNHRQGNNRIYADILNRIRVGETLTTDLETLKERIIENKFSSIPEDVLFVTATNAIVNDYNAYCLQLINEEEKQSLAVVERFEKQIYNPRLENGTLNVKNTPLKFDLRLKKGCKIMLTFNIDTSDGLTNGAFGTIIDFEETHGDLVTLFVHFDDPRVGEKLRKELRVNNGITPVRKIEFPYRENTHVSSGRVIQFPVRLAFASTTHKIQGITVKKPTALVVDINSTLEPAQAYVMLSRVQELSQIKVFGDFKENKIRHCPKALDEENNLKSTAMTSFTNLNKDKIILVCCNVYSLSRNFDILKKQISNFSNEAILLQETWFNSNSG